MKSRQAHSDISRSQKSSKLKSLGFWNFIDLHLYMLKPAIILMLSMSFKPYPFWDGGTALTVFFHTISDWKTNN